jgi:hypothetical protein
MQGLTSLEQLHVVPQCDALLCCLSLPLSHVHKGKRFMMVWLPISNDVVALACSCDVYRSFGPTSADYVCKRDLVVIQKYQNVRISIDIRNSVDSTGCTASIAHTALLGI